MAILEITNYVNSNVVLEINTSHSGSITDINSKSNVNELVLVSSGPSSETTSVFAT